MTDRNALADASLSDIRQKLFELNRRGDLDAVPVTPPDDTNWLQRFSAFVTGGGPWGTAQPGQRGAWVPSQINAQGKPEWAVPEYVENAADVATNLPRVGFTEIMRDPDGNRDIIRRLSEGSFDLAGMLPAAGSMIGAAARTRPTARTVQDASPAPAPRQSADMGAPHTVADYEYPRAPFQEDWPNRGPRAYGQDMMMLDPRGIWTAETGVPGAQVLKYQDIPARMRTVGQDPVPGVRGMDGRAVYSNPDDPTSAAVTAALAAQDKPKGIKAYHGSPHDFDRFDLSKIGTGEGAQAYGHGLYFAETPKVARAYEGMLAQNGYDPAVIARDALEAVGGDVKKAMDVLVKDTPAKMGLPEFDILTDNYGLALDMLKQHADGAPMPLPARGRMYEVNINASPEDFLDWDKPLSQQGEKVKGAFPSDLLDRPGSAAHDEMASRLAPIPPPDADSGWASITNTINDKVQRRDLLSQRLREAGIPGIRYLDQGSRTAGEGSRNYVVFDDKLVDILRKYSNAPDPTTGAILALLGQQGDTPSGAESDHIAMVKQGTVKDLSGKVLYNNPTTSAILALLAAQQGGQQPGGAAPQGGSHGLSDFVNAILGISPAGAMDYKSDDKESRNVIDRRGKPADYQSFWDWVRYGNPDLEPPRNRQLERWRNLSSEEKEKLKSKDLEDLSRMLNLGGQQQQ
jgi:hypothetical protein